MKVLYNDTMNILVILSGIFTLLFSLFLGIFVLFFGFNLFTRLTKNINEHEEIQKNNIAVAILCSSFLFSMGYILKTSVTPIVQTFFNMIFHSQEGILRFLASFGIMTLQFLVSLITAVIILWVGVKVFTWLNKGIKEFEEIKKNNIAVAILIGSIIITLSVFLQEGVEKLLQVIIITPGIKNGSLTPFG